MCLAKTSSSSKPTVDYTLNQFDADLRSFYDYCKANRLTGDEIARICRPLILLKNGKSSSNNNRKSSDFDGLKPARNNLRKAVLIVMLVVALYALSYAEPIAWHYAAIARLTMIDVALPLYDWRYLKNTKCLIAKPFPMKPADEFDCTYCESIGAIAFDADLDADHVNERYVDRDVPVVLLDGLSDWPVLNESFIEIVADDADIYQSRPCKLSTNLAKSMPIGRLLDKVLKSSSKDSYFVHFENCDYWATKSFRRYAPRPAFLPCHLSPIQYNWLLISRNYDVAQFKRVRLNDERVAVVAQINGANRIRLTPDADCYLTAECDALEVDLYAGESVLFTDRWTMEYKTLADGDANVNIAVILETH